MVDGGWGKQKGWGMFLDEFRRWADATVVETNQNTIVRIVGALTAETGGIPIDQINQIIWNKWRRCTLIYRL